MADRAAAERDGDRADPHRHGRIQSRGDTLARARAAEPAPGRANLAYLLSRIPAGRSRAQPVQRRGLLVRAILPPGAAGAAARLPAAAAGSADRGRRRAAW